MIQLIEHKQERDSIDWRRNKVQELSSQGHSQREIAQILQVSSGTINRDLSVEPDYDDDEKEGEEKQEQETGEITVN